MLNIRKKGTKIFHSLLKNLHGLLSMKRDRRNKIFNQNTDLINKKFESVEFNKDLEQYLSNYLSLALRITHYYGNLRIKYVTFNFTFIAFFASILTVYISLMVNFNQSLWYVGLTLVIGFIWYLLYFLIMLLTKFDTISFEQKDLQHFSCFMQINDYPNIKRKPLDDFITFIKRGKKDLIKDDLKTLVMQYIYQANYLRVGLKMRICLIFGSINLSLSIVFSFIMSSMVADPLMGYKFFVIAGYCILIFVAFVISLVNSSNNHLGIKKENIFPNTIKYFKYYLSKNERNVNKQ